MKNSLLISSIKKNNSEKLLYKSLMIFLLSTCWGIPIYGRSGIPWVMWPTLSDIGFVFLLFTLLQRPLRITSSDSNVKICFLFFLLLGVLSGILEIMTENLSIFRLKYLLYVIVNLLKLYCMWLACCGVHWNLRKQHIMGRVALVCGVIVSVAAYLQFFDVLDYRDLVSHLPSNKVIGGPWAVRTIYPSISSLGTLNYNRINTGLYLVLMGFIVIALEKSNRLAIVSYCLVNSSVLLTGSRSALLSFLISIPFLIYYYPKRMSKILMILLLLSLIGITSILFGSDFLNKVFQPDPDILNPVLRIFGFEGESALDHIHGRTDRQIYAFSDLLNLKRILFGYGFGMLTGPGGGYYSAHGEYATVIATCGIVGGVFFFLFYGRMLKLSLSNKTMYKISIPITAFIMVNLFLNDFLYPNPAVPQLPMILILICGQTYLSKNVKKNNVV